MPGLTSTNPYGGTDYFYSYSRGVDAALSGAVGTPEKPFKSFTHINDTLIPALVAGDRILFRSGDEWAYSSNVTETALGDLYDLSIVWVTPSTPPTSWSERNQICAYEGDTEATVITSGVSVKPIITNYCMNLGFGRVWEQTAANSKVWSGHLQLKNFGGPVMEDGIMVQQVANEAAVRSTQGSFWYGAGSEGVFTVDTIDNFTADHFDVTFTSEHGMLENEGVIFTGVTWNGTDINGENLEVEQVYSTTKIQVQRTAHGSTSASGGTGTQYRVYYRPRKGIVNPNTEPPSGKARIFAAVYGNRGFAQGLRATGVIAITGAAGTDDCAFLEISELDIRHSQNGISSSRGGDVNGLKIHDCDFFSCEQAGMFVCETGFSTSKDYEIYNNNLEYLFRIGFYIQSNNSNQINEDVRIYNNEFYWLDVDGYYHNSTYAYSDAGCINAQNPYRWHVYNNYMEKISNATDARGVLEWWHASTNGTMAYNYVHSNTAIDFYGTAMVIGSGLDASNFTDYNVIYGNLFISGGGTDVTLSQGIKSNIHQCAKACIVANNVVANCETNYWSNEATPSVVQPTKWYNNISISPTTLHFAIDGAAGGGNLELYNNRFFDDLSVSNIFGISDKGSTTNFSTFLTTVAVNGEEGNNEQIDIADIEQYIDSNYNPVKDGALYHAGKPAKFNAKDITNSPFYITPTIGCKEFTSGTTTVLPRKPGLISKTFTLTVGSLAAFRGKVGTTVGAIDSNHFFGLPILNLYALTSSNAVLLQFSNVKPAFRKQELSITFGDLNPVTLTFLTNQYQLVSEYITDYLDSVAGQNITVTISEII